METEKELTQQDVWRAEIEAWNAKRDDHRENMKVYTVIRESWELRLALNKLEADIETTKWILDLDSYAGWAYEVDPPAEKYREGGLEAIRRMREGATALAKVTSDHIKETVKKLGFGKHLT